MKQLLLVAAVVGLATTGCAQNKILGGRGCRGQACHVTRSQRAPRPNIMRTTCRPDRSCCDSGCDSGCTDGCCNDTYSNDVVYSNESYSNDGCCSEGYCSDGDGACYGDARGSDSEGRIVQRLASRVRNGKCGNCGGRGCGLCARVANRVNPHAGGYPEQTTFNPSPPMGQTAYPYYTTRGPRDFLQRNPPSIGPY